MTCCTPVRLHIDERGEGPAVILSHGFGGSARNFLPQVRALAPDYRVVVYDARGHARSEAPADPAEYAPECFVEDLLRVVERTGEERVVVGGLSMGAGVALRFALLHPERVRGVVLAAFPPASAGSWATAFADAIDAGGVEPAGSEFVWGRRSRFDPEGARLIRRGFLEHADHALSSTLRRLLAVEPAVSSLATALARLDTPVLLIVGSRDAGSLAVSEELARLLPDSELVVVAGAGHVVNLGDPEAFNAALRRFLARLARPAARDRSRGAR